MRLPTLVWAITVIFKWTAICGGGGGRIFHKSVFLDTPQSNLGIPWAHINWDKNILFLHEHKKKKFTSKVQAYACLWLPAW